MKKRLRPGDAVIYTVQKQGPHPGPRAKEVDATPHGEFYVYQVDKFWTVQDVTEDGRVVLRTRKGKTHLVDADDPRLRKAHWWERWLFRSRFPKFETQAAREPEAEHALHKERGSTRRMTTG